jgi:hypothetical protein
MLLTNKNHKKGIQNHYLINTRIVKTSQACSPGCINLPHAIQMYFGDYSLESKRYVHVCHHVSFVFVYTVLHPRKFPATL